MVLSRCLGAVGVAAALALPAPLLLAQTTTTRGEVTHLDRKAARVTLKHGEIKNLDMPPMTMSFHVVDAGALDSLAVGDRVRFTAERIEGRYTVTLLYKTP